MTNQARFIFILVPIFLAGTVSGCLGPGSDADSCTATLRSERKEFVGKSKTEKQARLNACNKFCLERDAEFDAMYRSWLGSEKAKILSAQKGRSFTKDEAIFADKNLLQHITRNCAVTCEREDARGQHTLETKCR
jgi:hypothetical protein